MSGAARRWSARLPVTVGFASVILLLGSLGAWSVGTRIAGAVVAPGVVQVESKRQVVQHPDGGVVGEILARDGDSVEAGDVLVRLDGTFLRSGLALVERQLAELFARRARLIAERDGLGMPDFGRPPDFIAIDAETIREQTDGQRTLFEARRVSLAQEQRQIGEQQSQIERQIEGLEGQLAALERQRELLASELALAEPLYEEGLALASRVLELRHEEARLQGETSRLISAVAEARVRISELEVAKVRLAGGRREEAIEELRDLQYAAIELEERRISLVERISRLDVRSPVAGTVFGSRVVALASVVQPAEAMMYVVAGDQPLQVSARIDPLDVDQVFVGQRVTLVFTAFSRTTAPEVTGTVARVSADAETDQATGAVFYEAVIRPDAAELAGAPGLSLVPGMPVEAFLRTEERSPLAYLTQPLTAYFNRAFREQ